MTRTPTTPSRADIVLHELERSPEGATAAQVVASTGLTKSQASNALATLKRQGKVHRTGHRYFAVPLGPTPPTVTVRPKREPVAAKPVAAKPDGMLAAIAAVWTAYLDVDPDLTSAQVRTMLDLADAMKRGES